MLIVCRVLVAQFNDMCAYLHLLLANHLGVVLWHGVCSDRKYWFESLLCRIMSALWKWNDLFVTSSWIFIAISRLQTKVNSWRRVDVWRRATRPNRRQPTTTKNVKKLWKCIRKLNGRLSFLWCWARSHTLNWSVSIARNWSHSSDEQQPLFLRAHCFFSTVSLGITSHRFDTPKRWKVEHFLLAKH